MQHFKLSKKKNLRRSRARTASRRLVWGRYYTTTLLYYHHTTVVGVRWVGALVARHSTVFLLSSVHPLLPGHPGFTIRRSRAVVVRQTSADINGRLAAYISSIQLDTVTR